MKEEKKVVVRSEVKFENLNAIPLIYLNRSEFSGDGKGGFFHLTLEEAKELIPVLEKHIIRAEKEVKDFLTPPLEETKT